MQTHHENAQDCEFSCTKHFLSQLTLYFCWSQNHPVGHFIHKSCNFVTADFTSTSDKLNTEVCLRHHYLDKEAHLVYHLQHYRSNQRTSTFSLNILTLSGWSYWAIKMIIYRHFMLSHANNTMKMHFTYKNYCQWLLFIALQKNWCVICICSHFPLRNCTCIIPFLNFVWQFNIRIK